MKIEWQNKIEDVRFLEVRVDGSFWKSVFKTLFLKKLSLLRKCSTVEELNAAFLNLECQVAQQLILRYLSKRDYFEKELTQRLLEKRLSPQAIQTALNKGREWGYLKDEALMKRYVQELRRKGKGPRYITQQLTKKLGYRPEIERDENSEQQAILALIHKRFPRLAHPTQQEKGRLYRFLSSRGFDREQILHVLANPLQ